MNVVGRFAIPFLLALPFVARAEDLTKLSKDLEAKVRSSGVPMSELALYVSAGDAEPVDLLDINSTKVMIPASITKLATASAVLDAFPPGTKFKTQLWLASDPKGAVVKGDLFLKGGGDPGFVSEGMWFLVNAFTRTGVTKIEGDIVVDDKLFDDVRFDESRESARVDRAYDAPVGAMSFNWNSINVFVRPGERGKPARVFLDPENGYAKLINKTKTVGGGANTIAVDRGKMIAGDSVTVSGNLGDDRAEIVIYKNITKPDLWSGENLREFLRQRGIEVTGKVRTGATPAGAKLAAEAESKAIEQMLADMNKFSNNFVAEMLTKNLASQNEKPATLAGGIKRVNDHLREIGLDPKEYVFLNPSGLTRENRFTARAMWKVLRHLRKDFRVQPELLSSLPIAGIDGTLKKRMKGTGAERWVRAKTGLLNGVTALAGYAGRKDGVVFTFVFIHNGKTDESRMRSLFDSWLVRLVE